MAANRALPGDRLRTSFFDPKVSVSRSSVAAAYLRNQLLAILPNKMFRFCADLYVWSSSFQAPHYANIVQMFVMLQNVRNNFVKHSKCLQKCQEWKQSRAKCHPIYTSFDSEVCRLTVVFIDVKSIAINITIFRNNLNICWNFPTCPKTFHKKQFKPTCQTKKKNMNTQKKRSRLVFDFIGFVCI